MVLEDADLLIGGGGDNAILDEYFSILSPLVFDGEVEEYNEDLETDECISNEEIAHLFSKESERVVYSRYGDENNAFLIEDRQGWVIKYPFEERNTYVRERLPRYIFMFVT